MICTSHAEPIDRVAIRTGLPLQEAHGLIDGGAVVPHDIVQKRCHKFTNTLIACSDQTAPRSELRASIPEQGFDCHRINGEGGGVLCSSDPQLMESAPQVYALCMRGV